MRALIVAVAFLALPALAVAQQAGDQADVVTPTVQMEQTTTSSPAPADLADVEASEEAPAQVQSHTAPADAAQAGDPTTTRWWWLVGAIVVAGILLAVLL